jgi:hypothetical protein
MSETLWIVPMGHSGSGFMMQGIIDAGIVEEPHEWPPLVEANRQIVTELYGNVDWCQVNLDEVRRPHEDPADRTLQFPRVVKDPQLSITAPHWFSWLQPDAVLFMTRDPIKNARARCRTRNLSRKAELLYERNARQRLAGIIALDAHLMKRGVPTFIAQYPEFWENDSYRADLELFLFEHAFADEVSDNVMNALERIWKPEKVHVR